jgi:hypothetical protein
VNWTAFFDDYIPYTPSCAAGYSVQGPDVVLSYKAPATTTVNFAIAKPSVWRYVAMVSSVCGNVTSPLTCTSNYLDTSLTGSFWATAGSTYYIYVAGMNTPIPSLLHNPLTITIGP